MLNDTFVRSLKPTGKPKKHFDGGGMSLFVTATGNKLWRMVYHFDKKEKLPGFGQYCIHAPAPGFFFANLSTLP
jgi:hypothetical protein